MHKQKTIYLTPPALADENIAEKITCIRGHRERIARVEPETVGSKIIFHNYGQGGAGWTFLFGCVHESLRQFNVYVLHKPKKPIAVIGAGAYGLLTAIMLTRAGYQVTLYASQEHDLTSNKAAGFFFPRWRKKSTPEEIALFLRYGIDSYAAYSAISTGQHPFIASGASFLPAYYSVSNDPGFTPYAERGLMPAPEQVCIDFQNGLFYPAIAYQSLFVDVPVMMAEFKRLQKELAIGLVIKTVESLAYDLAEQIIFNCTGWGARNLTGDKLLVPIQGHLITLKNQQNQAALKYLINVKIPMPHPKGGTKDELLYYAPKEDGVLGITFMRGQADPAANQQEFARLINRARTFFGT
jgi:D-amino-acid oxidase